MDANFLQKQVIFIIAKVIVIPPTAWLMAS